MNIANNNYEPYIKSSMVISSKVKGIVLQLKFVTAIMSCKNY